MKKFTLIAEVVNAKRKNTVSLESVIFTPEWLNEFLFTRILPEMTTRITTTTIVVISVSNLGKQFLLDKKCD